MFRLDINQLINDDQFPLKTDYFSAELGSYFNIDFTLHFLNFEMNSHNILVINITLEKLEKSLKYSSTQIISFYNFENNMKCFS